jgi:hypothetical protein
MPVSFRSQLRWEFALRFTSTERLQGSKHSGGNNESPQLPFKCSAWLRRCCRRFYNDQLEYRA